MNRQTLGVVAGSRPGGVASSRANVWKAVVRILRSPLQLLDDLVVTIVPATCRVCAGPLYRASDIPVCEACVALLAPDTPVACWRCGDGLEFSIDPDMEDERFALGMGSQLQCRECRMAPPPFDRAVSFGTYSGELKALIRLLKFGRVPAVARLLSRRLGQATLQLEGLAADDLLVTAVPLFKRRQRQRGFNQSTLLVNATLRWLKRERPQWKLTVAHGLLSRQRPTESSFGLSKRARRLNMSGAFRVQGDVRGRQVLVIDDILTTGATARECAKVLRRAGAEKVWIATLARSRRAIAASGEREEQTAVWDMAPQKVEQHAT